MMIKVCGITRREDAEAAVNAGASALGFVFYPPSPRCVDPGKAAALASGLDVLKVGIFQDEPASSIEATMRAAQLDVAQIYGRQIPHGVRFWRAFRMNHAIPEDLAAGAEAVLLDGPMNGSGFDWTRARGMAGKVIVAGGLDASNVAQAIRAARPWGVDASSKLESAPGIKDHEKVRAFVAAARRAGQEV
jgi:phosphoribosylanthranilate isomerase